MHGPSATLRFVLSLLLATVGPPGISAEGDVGCLFSLRLCLEDVEWCYDDFAFGRCLPTTGDIDEEDLYRYDLEKPILHGLSRELRRLFALGYRWSHAYTQCRLQGMLFAVKNDVPFEHSTCFHLVDQDLEGALKALEGQDELDPREVAVVKYTPSAEDPHAEFADEVYYPPSPDEAALARQITLPQNGVDLYDMEDPYSKFQVTKRHWIPRKPTSLTTIFNERYNTPKSFRSGQETRDLQFPLNFRFPDEESFLTDDEIEDSTPEVDLEGMTEFYPMINFLNKLRLSDNDIDYLLSPENYDKLQGLVKEFEENERDVNLEDFLKQRIPERFSLKYNTPEGFRAGWEAKDALPEDLSDPRVYVDEADNEDGYQRDSSINTEEFFNELKQLHDKYGYNFDPTEKERYNIGLARRVGGNAEGQSGVYTEGGVVYVPDSQIAGDGKLEDELKEDLGELLEEYNSGFKRPERLDVKKPGPRYDISKYSETTSTTKKMDGEENVLLPSMIKKEPRGAHPNPSHDNSFDVDSDFTYVTFKNSMLTWNQGEMIIRNISNLLHLEPNTLTDKRTGRNEVTFKVGPNHRGLNASEVARRIDLLKDQLEAATGYRVVSTGIGDKVKYPTVLTIAADTDNSALLLILSACGGLTLIVAIALVVVMRHHIISREKLSGLERPDVEASKDYQDLCRARMATKAQTTSETVHGRITSLSKESEQSPSSRSSTSSWSEEPALHNMDISTGHMVLSYMEDHLKNKDRLDQEWVGLCAYEAEPCATTVALTKDNIEKNRYPNILPYDHARVVLNDLSNVSGSDYINASSITDHDPRNPAYIAAQGALPHTAPDFWQLIWEQGAVVIVMLTRLTEGGAAMCHRYWPEEGSEVYHIYEVHLVSEHIWCDDYLVRSFYLKNTRTGETRTVTQFHFLSWSEGGIPSSTKALLEFRRKVNKSYRGRSCPIVVHCSDGAGRTGTYCLIDMVLSRMAKGAKEIDIAATLEHLRDQRPGMVATKQQFEFVLTAVAEEVHAILKALPPSSAQTEKDKEKEKQ